MPKSTLQSHQNEQSLRDEIAHLHKSIQELTERSERKVRTLQAQLHELAIHDPLTGLYSRRHLNETFDRELMRAERYDHPISAIIVDIDNFKVINETYGHLAGDEVLRAFGALLIRNSRASDISCRYGGEEFLLVLPNMKEADACSRAEQLRRLFVTTPITSGASVIHATASFGVAIFPEHGRTSEELIAAADAALISAKSDGRNQVKLYNLLMSSNNLI